MKGKLYVIGVGPGDPELLTIKGMKILNRVSCVCVPKGREEGSSLALSIVGAVVDLKGKEIIEAHFPMKKTAGKVADESGSLNAKWSETVKSVYAVLSRGVDLAFITIGDPGIYSTFFYLYDKLLEMDPELDIEIVPGVSSINASAARAGISLGLADDKIAIVPATYTESLASVLESFDTIVLMKVHRVFDAIVGALAETGLTDKALYIARAGMSDEKIIRTITEVTPGDLNYFSLVIVRK